MSSHRQICSQARRRTTITQLIPPISVAKTQYTIDDSECPPTRSHILHASVTKACASLENFLSKKPMAAHTKQAFDTLVEMAPDTLLCGKPIILDSGCGTGRSTLLLGEMYPDHLVIGVDRSFTRITKKSQQKTEESSKVEISISDDEVSSKRPFCQQVSDNVILVRAELVDFWTCCLQHNMTIQHHYMLYPNPYPTQTRVTQRWYAHPSFPMLLQLKSETITIRSNWNGYLKEFAKAVEIAHEYYSDKDASEDETDNYALLYLQSAQRGPTRRTDKSVAWTNFEQKYDDVGEETYELILSRNGRENHS